MIDIDCIDRSVEMDDTLFSFIDLSWFLPISSIYIGKYISSSVHQKIKTEFMQTVNLLIIELQLIVEGSNNYPHSFFLNNLLKNLSFSLKPGLKSQMVDIDQV